MSTPAHISARKGKYITCSHLFACRQAVAVLQQGQCQSHVLLCSLTALKLGLMGASIPAGGDKPLQLPVRVCTAGQACKQLFGFLVQLQLAGIAGAHLHQRAHSLQPRFCLGSEHMVLSTW